MSYWLQSLDQNGPTASSQRVTQISKCPVLSPSIVLMPRALMITLSLCSSAGWYYIYVFSKGISNFDYPEDSVLLCLHEYSNIYVFCVCFFFLLECWVLNWIYDCGNKLLSLTMVFTSVPEPIQRFPLQCHPHFNTVLVLKPCPLHRIKISLGSFTDIM